MKPRPIEVVVIRNVLALRAAPACPEPDEGVDVPASLPAPVQRDVDALLETLRCPVRQSILLSLTSAGAACVGPLAARLGRELSQVSNHLRPLRMMGFVHGEQQGKQVCYTAAGGRVRLDRRPDGFSLTLFARGDHGGASVTVTVPGAQSL